MFYKYYAAKSAGRHGIFFYSIRNLAPKHMRACVLDALACVLLNSVPVISTPYVALMRISMLVMPV